MYKICPVKGKLKKKTIKKVKDQCPGAFKLTVTEKEMVNSHQSCATKVGVNVQGWWLEILTYIGNILN